MYCATVVNFKLKVQIVNDLLGKNFFGKIALWQKPRMEKYEFPKKLPFPTTLMYMSLTYYRHPNSI